MVASFSVTLGLFFYRELEKDKIKALEENKHNYEAVIRLSM